jgi:DNA-binding transcriptional LysR family regulator
MLTTSGLRALVAIVDHGTFGAAAVALGYTQSTVSQQIRTLERDAGGPIFDRRSGPIRSQLTSLGHVLEHHARLVVHELDAAEQAAIDHRDGRGRLTIGTFQAVTTTILPSLLRTLAQEHPASSVALLETEDPVPDLDSTDLCFFDSPPRPPDHGELIVADDHFLLAPRGAFPPGPVDLSDLDGRRMVALPAICDQGRVEQSLSEAGVRLDIVFRTADNHALTALVEAGTGCAVLPALSISRSESIGIHPLRPALPRREIWAQWRGSLSPLARRALELAVAARPDVQPF